jgi:transcriptional regulator with XRE-family HTH domain
VTNTDYRAAVCAEIVRLMSEERKRRGLSKNKVAYMTGLNQSTVSRLENHPDNPTLDSLLRVAQVLELNLGNVLKLAIHNVEEKSHFTQKPVRAGKRPPGRKKRRRFENQFPKPPALDHD